MPRYQDICRITQTKRQMNEYRTCGTCVWTVPTGTTVATFEIWGAGGGGGARCCCECYHSGPGGAGGGYARTTIAVNAGDAYSLCIGGGGMVCVAGVNGYHWCCYGQDGGTSYITGTGLSNFCATGGGGGTNDCYNQCGCMTTPGIGYGGGSTPLGGNTLANGTPGTIAGFSDAQPYTLSTTGTGAYGPNMQFFKDECSRCCIGRPGTFPGGGGETPSHYNCCCYQAGVGANGFIRIQY